MYTSTYIFATRSLDSEFHALDRAVAAAAKAVPGYLGEVSWENPALGLVSNVYYWQSLEDLQVLMKDPTHLIAKASHSRWLDGYRVVIAKLEREYSVKGLGLVAAP